MALDAAVYGVLGAFVGAAGSIGAIWIQSHYQAKRERAKSIIEMAVKSRSEEMIEGLKKDPEYRPMPLAVHANLQQKLFKLIEDGDLSTSAVTKIYDQCAELSAAIANADLSRPTM